MGPIPTDRNATATHPLYLFIRRKSANLPRVLAENAEKCGFALTHTRAAASEQARWDGPAVALWAMAWQAGQIGHIFFGDVPVGEP